MENERDLLPLFDHLSDGICITGEGEKLLYMNPAAERILEVKWEQAAGMRLCDLVCARLSNSGCANCAENCALLGPGGGSSAVAFEGRFGPSYSFSWRSGHVARAERWRRLRVRCLKTETGWLSHAQPEKHLMIIEDDSDRASLEQEREDWRSMIAHDLRNPLANIFGALRSLQEDAGESGRTAPIVDIGVSNCRRMIELLDLYLDVAKLDAGLMPAEIRPVDLAAAAAECAREQSPIAAERGIVLSVEVPGGLTAAADAGLLARVLQNLVDNALKFASRGGAVRLRAGREGATVELVIEDSGPGIPAAELDKLFDRFHQARARRDGRSKGTGLGLAFCREALRAMRGDVRAENRAEGGARFVVRLPSV